MNENLKIIISATADKLKSAVKDAKSEIGGLDSKTSSSAKSIKQKFADIGSSAKDAVGKASKAIAGGITSLVGFTAATENYRVNQAKLQAAFKSAGASAEVATETYNGLYRVLGDGDVATEAANHLAKLTTNQQDLSEWTNICKGVYATFGDSLPIEGLTEAANETAKVGTVTGSLADALNWAGISEDAFNEKLAKCNTEAEREKLIRQTLNGIYDEAAAEYEKNAGAIIRQNEAQAKLQKNLAKLGAVLTPVVTLLTESASGALAFITPMLEDLANATLPLIESAVEELKTKMEELKTKVEEATTWLQEHETAVTLAAIALGTLTAAVVAYNIARAIANAGGIVEVAQLAALTVGYYALAIAEGVATVATTAFGAAIAFLTSPVTLVIAAIGAVIAIIVLCVKHWDEIKAKVTEVAKTIANKVSEMKEKVVKFFGELPEKVKAKVEELKQKAVAKFEEIKTSISAKATNAKEKVVGVFGSIKDGVATKIEATKTAVSDKFEAIKTNMRNKIQSAKESVVNIFGNIKEGIANKIEAAKEKVKNVIDKIKGFFNFKWSLPKLKLPKISISGKFSLSPPSVPKFSISWNKLGGVFDKPTLFSYGNTLQGIGEDGAEAVVPLEKNTQWLDRLADRLAAKQNGVPIVLQVDGKTFAQVSIDSINSLTRQRGKLGLNLV